MHSNVSHVLNAYEQIMSCKLSFMHVDNKMDSMQARHKTLGRNCLALFFLILLSRFTHVSCGSKLLFCTIEDGNF